MTICSVPGCVGIGGHIFPKSPMKKKAWVIAIKRESMSSKGKLWEPSSGAVVCRKHFKDDDYRQLNKKGKLCLLIQSLMAL